jgi:hypothetical protein
MKKIFVALLLFSAFSCVTFAEEKKKEQKKEHGPDVVFGNYTKSVHNPIMNFMYFVPLVSPVTVYSTINESNTQMITIVKLDFEKDDDEFTAACHFEVRGSGWYLNQFDPPEMMLHTLEGHEDEDGGHPKLKNMLDYIKLDGNCNGVFEIEGSYDKDGKVIINKVDLSFSGVDGVPVPVTVELYSAKYDHKQKKYDYAQRYERTVVRIKHLGFERVEKDGTPKMELTVGSIGNGKASDSLWSITKGWLANFFIPPVAIDKLGNKTLFEFCSAIVNKQNAYRFPKAEKVHIVIAKDKKEDKK